MRLDLASQAFVLYLSPTAGGVALPASTWPSALLPVLLPGSKEMISFISINSFAGTQVHQGAPGSVHIAGVGKMSEARSALEPCGRGRHLNGMPVPG